MPTTLIVCANASRARIFTQRSLKDPLEEVADLVNPAAREREGDIVTDGLGQRAAGKSRHSMGQPHTGSSWQPRMSPQQHEAELFAQDVVAEVDKARNEGRCDKLCLVASPEFLGVLRRKMATRLGAMAATEIGKDYTHDSPQQLRERLAELSRPH